MALALLASRNESYFGEQKVYTRKNTSSNPNPKHCPNPNFNRQIAGDGGHESDLRPQHEFGSMDLDETSTSAAAASNDSSSFHRNPADLDRRRDPEGGYVSFRISSYSRKERRELKRRLEAELERVRRVSSRIESGEIQSDYALQAIPGSDAFIGRSAPRKLHTDEIKKRPPPAASSPELRKLHTGMMKKCGQMLTRLMKHKGGIWFNFPVDVEGMGLHDYHLVVKNPMDLGTVKSKLGKGFYSGPFEFASDIRLTFNNALTYNPKGHVVHNYADQLLKLFENSFRAACAKYEKDRSGIERREEEQRQRAASWPRVAPAPPEPAAMISVPPVQSKPLPSLPVRSQQQQQQQQQQAVRTMKQPLPKPKVSEPNERAMSLEEKERLGYAIQSLPDAKMAEVLQILSNRENVTSTNGDEVEIDFEVMDNETLWVLDRFVVDWNKTISSRMKKRQPETTPPLSLPSDASNKSPAVAGKAPEAPAVKKSKKGDPVDEDVDIGDEMPVTHYPSVEIEKESSSSSSASDSSSSSDSDSGSSSGSYSDDDARSPDGRREANTTRCS